MLPSSDTNQSFMFSKVYLAAYNNNESWLTHDNKAFLDVRHGFYTPASKLAKEGHNQAVLLLIKLGANVHEAGMGAAMGKNKPLAEILRKKYGASPNFIAKGAVIVGDYEYAEELQHKYGASIEIIAEGAAIRNDLGYVDKVLSSYELNFEPHKTRLISRIAKGAMIGGNREYALKLIDDGADIKEIMQGVNITGDLKYAEELVSKYNLDISYLAHFVSYNDNREYCTKLREDNRWNTDTHYRNSVIAGVAEGWSASGNMLIFNDFSQFINDMEKDGDNVSGLGHYINGIIKYGIIGQLIDEGNKSSFIKKLALHLLLEGSEDCIGFAVHKGDFKVVLWLYYNIMLFQNLRRERLLDLLANGMLLNDFFRNEALTVHQLSFIDDHSFLNVYRKVHTLFNSEIVDAIKTNETMKRYNIDYDQARAFLYSTELRKLFLYFPFHDFNILPLNISIHIAMSFSLLSFESTNDLYSKISTMLNKSFLNSDIKKYQSGLWIDHRKRATSFLDASKDISNRGDLAALIHYQKNLFDGVEKSVANNELPKHEQSIVNNSKDKFYEIVEKYSMRMK